MEGEHEFTYGHQEILEETVGIEHYDEPQVFADQDFFLEVNRSDFNGLPLDDQPSAEVGQTIPSFNHQLDWPQQLGIRWPMEEDNPASPSMDHSYAVEGNEVFGVDENTRKVKVAEMKVVAKHESDATTRPGSLDMNRSTQFRVYQKLAPVVKPKKKPLAGQRKPCKCAKSKCLKMYCVCFAKGELCRDCDCKGCHNDESHKEERTVAVKTSIAKDPNAFKPKHVPGVGSRGKTEAVQRVQTRGCCCKKSKCAKNYCECYEANLACTINCKCCGCKNPNGDNKPKLVHRASKGRVSLSPPLSEADFDVDVVSLSETSQDSSSSSSDDDSDGEEICDPVRIFGSPFADSISCDHWRTRNDQKQKGQKRSGEEHKENPAAKRHHLSDGLGTVHCQSKAAPSPWNPDEDILETYNDLPTQQMQDIQDTEDHISKLPDRCALSILSRLNRNDLNEVKRVSKNMYRLAKEACKKVKWRGREMMLKRDCAGYHVIVCGNGNCYIHSLRGRRRGERRCGTEMEGEGEVDRSMEEHAFGDEEFAGCDEAVGTCAESRSFASLPDPFYDLIKKAIDDFSFWILTLINIPIDDKFIDRISPLLQGYKLEGSFNLYNSPIDENLPFQKLSNLIASLNCHRFNPSDPNFPWKSLDEEFVTRFPSSKLCMGTNKPFLSKIHRFFPTIDFVPVLARFDWFSFPGLILNPAVILKALKMRFASSDRLLSWEISTTSEDFDFSILGPEFSFIKQTHGRMEMEKRDLRCKISFYVAVGWSSFQPYRARIDYTPIDKLRIDA